MDEETKAATFLFRKSTVEWCVCMCFGSRSIHGQSRLESGVEVEVFVASITRIAMLITAFVVATSLDVVAISYGGALNSWQLRRSSATDYALFQGPMDVL